MEGIKLDYKTRNVTWYSLRHFGITCRIRAGNILSDIGQIAGTSVSHIESHYGHYDVDMLRKTALKNFTIDKNGMSVRSEKLRKPCLPLMVWLEIWKLEKTLIRLSQNFGLLII